MPHPEVYARLILSLALASPAVAAPDCTAPGNEALSRSDYATAAARFEVARGRADCAADEVTLLLNEAYARQRLAEGGDPAQACSAADLYRRVERAAVDAEVRAVAAARSPELQRVCEPPENALPPHDDPPADGRDARPPVEPPRSSASRDVGPARDTELYWLWGSAAAFTLAGGVTYGFALAADADRADARRAYNRATAAGDRAGWEAAEADFSDAREDTNALGLTSIGLLAVGVVVGAFALEATLSDEEPTVTPALSPAGAGLVGTF